MHAIRSRLVMLVVALATLACSAPAIANESSDIGPVPIGAPSPLLDGQPFALGAALDPSVSVLTQAPYAHATLLTRIVADPSPHVVAQRIDLFSGDPIGDPVTLSDAATVPVDGAASALAAAAIQLPDDSSVAAQEGAQLDGLPEEWLAVWVAHDGAGVRLVGRRFDAGEGTPLGQPQTLSDGVYDAIGDVELVWQAPDPRMLVVWSGTRASDDGRAQVHMQGWDHANGRVAPDDAVLSSAAGSVLGSLGVTFTFDAVAPDTPVSDVDDGSARSIARTLVVWRGTDPGAIGNADEQELLGRVLDERNTPLGGVVRLSHVGTDGDPVARPVEAAINGTLLWQSPPYAWLVAWSQSPSGDAAVRRLDADAQGPAASSVTPADPAAAIGRVALTGFEGGDDGLVYDIGSGDGPRSVALQQLHGDGTVVGDPLQLSADGADARAPLTIATNYQCRQLVVWREAAAAVGRFLWESGCPELMFDSASSQRGLVGAMRLTPRRFHARSGGHGGAWLHARLYRRATLTVTIARCTGHGAVRRRCTHPRVVRTSHRIERRAGVVKRLVRGHARDGSSLAPGRYRLTLRAAHRRAVTTRRLRFTLLG